MLRFFTTTGRFLFIASGIIVLTSLSIDATQYLSGSQSALGILAQKATQVACPALMVKVTLPENAYICIDQYEVSPAVACNHTNPQSVQETAVNLESGQCKPVTVKGMLPWTNIAKPQAEQACARSGKRLPTNGEWYAAAFGTPDNKNDCNISSSGSKKAGVNAACRSGLGAYDMVGNVWEWVSDEVVEGQFNGSALPPEGYIAAVSQAGLPVMTTTTAQAIFNDDYLWSVPSGNRVIMRGGFYGSQSDAGVYSMHASAEQMFVSDAIGFRCAMTLR